MPPIAFAEPETKDLVSIVIPTYRGERFIGETLASVGSQRYPHWEVIVVEDTACDNATKAIVDEFARRHPFHRIVYLCNERNGGPSHSRNVAFTESRGEFIAPLDCDDRWLPDYLATYVQALRNLGKDVAYSSVLMIEDRSERLLEILGPTPQELENFPLSLFHRSFIIPSGAVFRRQVLADVGPWDVDLRLAEDLAYWLRCAAAGKQFQHIGGCHCLYRKNAAEAATQKVAATLEAFARVTHRHMLPGAEAKTCRRLVSRAYRRAARRHRQAEPHGDSSADPSRAPMLWREAWRLMPHRIDYFLRGATLGFADRFRRRPSPSNQSPASTEHPPARLAA